MIFLGIKKETEVRAEVSFIHYRPEILPDEVKVEGVLIDNDELLVPENVVGKNAIHYINPQTKEQWFEYVDRPLSTEEEMEQLKQQLVAQQAAINMILGV